MRPLAVVVAVLWSIIFVLVGALAVGYLGSVVIGYRDAVALTAIIVPSVGVLAWWLRAWWRHDRSR